MSNQNLKASLRKVPGTTPRKYQLTVVNSFPCESEPKLHLLTFSATQIRINCVVGVRFFCCYSLNYCTDYTGKYNGLTKKHLAYERSLSLDKIPYLHFSYVFLFFAFYEKE